jgi:hypothetical protein
MDANCIMFSVDVSPLKKRMVAISEQKRVIDDDVEFVQERASKGDDLSKRKEHSIRILTVLLTRSDSIANEINILLSQYPQNCGEAFGRDPIYRIFVWNINVMERSLRDLRNLQIGPFEPYRYE